LNVRIREILDTIDDRDRCIEAQIDLLEYASRVFRRYDELTIIASEIYGWLVKRVPEIIDYYKRIKRESIRQALERIEEFRDYLRRYDGYERFRYATIFSIAGNILDTGVYGLNTPLHVSIEDALSKPLAIDHTRRAYELFGRGGLEIMWLFDNAGESVYDTLLIGELKSMCNRVIGVVKDDPGFQNDLTISDAVEHGLDRYVDRLVSTGYSGSSIHLDRVSREFRELLDSVDIIVSKGMAHYEYLSEIDLGKPVLYLLIPKCDPIARRLGVEKYSYVAMLRGSSGKDLSTTI
jgi:uncharacterized protein with ATP-grasp and redox domains